MSPLSPHTHAINTIKIDISISASSGNELIKSHEKIAALKCPPKTSWSAIFSKLNRLRREDEGKKGALFGHLMDHGMLEL